MRGPCAERTIARWQRFSLAQQLRMIANEMTRTGRMAGDADRLRRRDGYERVLALVDMTVACRPRPGLLREMLRWRDLVADRFLDDHLDERLHREALRALLLLDPLDARRPALAVARGARVLEPDAAPTAG